ncbi:MAG: ankyrin repeat domain-containing protein [Thiohalocapsa sp.]|nr:ankyrin repeat domain-containing protein [Thiohalocapsa sp.]MCF7992678.1 ankyrin repeat domain-containing protein [Thiohalocapsa sp.]
MNKLIRLRNFHRLLLILVLSWAVLGVGCDRTPDVQQQGMQLLQVAEQGDISALDALLRSNAHADFRDSCDWTPLMKAANNGHTEAVRRLLSAGAEADAADKGGYTSLLLAASNNHAEIVEVLLSRGAMIDAREQTQGYTPLIWAAHRGHADTVRTLLAHGADTTLPDFAGRTAADHAAAEGRADISAMLQPSPTSADTAAR